MNTRRRAAAAAILTLALAGGGAAAYAATSSGPPVNTVPGPYFQQGTPVNLCIKQSDESAAYAELHSQQLGNCTAGYVQLTISADPDALSSPAASPTASPTSSSTSG